MLAKVVPLFSWQSMHFAMSELFGFIGLSGLSWHSVQETSALRCT